MQNLVKDTGGGGGLDQAQETREGTGLGGLSRLHRSTEEVRRPEELEPPAAEFGFDDSSRRQWQAAGAGWPICGVERANRRLLSYRPGRSGSSDLLGVALPARKSRCRRSASHLVDRCVSCASG